MRPILLAGSLALAIASLLALSEGGTASADPADSAEATVARGGRAVHVDSILPIEEELRRFRAALGDTVRALASGATSRDSLVHDFLRAVETADTSAMRGMLLTASEFAWLYYPTSINVEPPYELGPGLAWFQLQNGSSKGISRLWQRYAGRSLNVVGYRCPAPPLEQGENRIWTECALTRAVGGDTTSIRLFGAILSRDGRYKFLSWANDL